jgi:GTP cyclohydrolase I
MVGVTPQILKQLQEWAKTHSVTVRLSAEESCKYLRTVTRDVESATSHVTTWSGGFTRKDTVVTRVTEYFWQFTAKWELKAFKGTGAESVVLQSHTVR